LAKEHLNEYDDDLAIHDYDLPKVGLGLPVAVVEEPVLGLDFQ